MRHLTHIMMIVSTWLRLSIINNTKKWLNKKIDRIDWNSVAALDELFGRRSSFISKYSDSAPRATRGWWVYGGRPPSGPPTTRPEIIETAPSKRKPRTLKQMRSSKCEARALSDSPASRNWALWSLPLIKEQVWFILNIYCFVIWIME